MEEKRNRKRDDVDFQPPAVDADVDNEKVNGGSVPQVIRPDEDLIAEMKAEIEQERHQWGNEAVTDAACTPQDDDSGNEQAKSLDAARAASGRPIIDMTDRPMHEVSDEALTALTAVNNPPRLFRQAKNLIRIVQDISGDTTSDFLDIDSLRGEVDRAAYFITKSKYRTRHTTISDKCLKDILYHPRRLDQFPPLEGLTYVPLLRPDGTVLDTPGYDAPTKLFYAPAPGLVVPPIPDQPGAAQITAAAKKLHEPLMDFPFVDDSSRCNAVGLLVTAIIRPAIPGVVPMAMITSPAPCSGKSLLAQTVTRIASGRASESIMLSDHVEDQKRITAFFAEGGTILSLDNETGILRSVSVARVLTEPRWKNRLLGLNRTLDVPIRITAMVTGNNLKASTEITRRCYPVRLDTHVARPWMREVQYLHPDLDTWAMEHRGEVIAACLTLARAHALAGRPSAPNTPRTGNFDVWAKLVGGILHIGGFTNFLNGIEDFYGQNDDEGQEWESLLQAIHRKFGTRSVTTVEIAELEAQEFPEWLAEHYSKPSFPVKLGKALGKIMSRPFGSTGLRIEKDGRVHGKITWRVHIAAEPSDASESIVELRPAPRPVLVPRKNLQTTEPISKVQ